MKKHFLLILILSAFSVAEADSRNYTDSFRKKRFIGFNVNPLLSQVTPFNNIRQGISDPAIMMRSYNGMRGTRFAAGINTDVNTLEFLAFSLMAGYSTRKKMYNNFYWISGVELRIRAINNNPNSGNSNTLGDEFFGIATVFGIEYQINNALSISTETALELGTGLGFNANPSISLRPPVSLHLHLFIPRK